jgi:UDP-N-acetylglucosamine 2-epimerase
MPEEINRVVADHLSDLLLCPSQTAIDNLAAEGIVDGVHLVGDVMLDVLNWARQRADRKAPEILAALGLRKNSYLLTTVHRSENTDDVRQLARIVEALNAVEEPLVFPIHPRARKVLASAQISLGSHVQLIDPVGYVDMIALASSARLIMTDSGGLQKEAYWLGVPCVTLRQETEWVETVDAGWNTLVGANSSAITNAVRKFVPSASRPPLYGDGEAAASCVALLGRGAAALSAPR